MSRRAGSPRTSRPARRPAASSSGARPDQDRWARLLTESRNPRSRALDTLGPDAIVRLLLDEDRRALVAAGHQHRAISRAAVEVARAIGAGGQVVFLGAGTSGRLGVLEAAECPPTFGTDPDLIQAVMAGGQGAVFKAVEGAEDRAPDGAREGRRLRAKDLLVGIRPVAKCLRRDTRRNSVDPVTQGLLARFMACAVCPCDPTH